MENLNKTATNRATEGSSGAGNDGGISSQSVVNCHKANASTMQLVFTKCLFGNEHLRSGLEPTTHN